MSTLMRRAGFGALIVLGLLAGQDLAQAQYSFGNTPYGLNVNNPYIANRNYMYNLQVGRAALANSMAFPSPGFAMPSPLPAYNPYAAYGGNPYLGGANPYMPAVPGVAIDPYAGAAGGAGSNPYAPLSSAYDPYASNPYSAAGYSPYSNPAAGPGFTLMGGADVLRAYGTVITKQEEARIMRQQYNVAKLDYAKKKFDLEMYIKNNTPTFTEEQAKVTKTILKRIQTNSNPAEVVDGRSLNFLLDDVDKYRNKATISDIELPMDVMRHVNVKPAGIDTYSLGLLRDSGKLNWPSALVETLPAETRTEMEARAMALAQDAAKGKNPDRNALKDLGTQIDQAMTRLVKKANDFGTSEYMDAKRFLGDLENARKAIDRGTASVQTQYQQMLTKGDIHNVNDLVKVMIDRGWRFAQALPSDEAAYRALHSALVAYDIALNQQVAQAEGN